MRIAWLRLMNCRRWLFPVLLVVASLGCHSNGIKVLGVDGGAADVARAADLPSEDSIRATGPESVDALSTSDVFGLGPDASAALPDARAADLPVAKDLVPPSDNATSPDASNAADVLAPADLGRIPDGASESSSPPPDASDAKVQASEVSGDLASEAPPLPKDVTVYTNKDLGTADAKCVAATPGWLSLVSTFLAEDQKCWADTDCTYVSFDDSCGMICVLPMNEQRIGEFGSQVYGYATANCSTCPSPASYPSCPAPTTVYCNAGRCAYKAN